MSARVIIARLSAEGMGPTAIARHLNATGVPTPSGRGRWYCETVHRHGAGREGWATYMRNYRAARRVLNASRLPRT